MLLLFFGGRKLVNKLELKVKLKKLMLKQPINIFQQDLEKVKLVHGLLIKALYLKIEKIL